MKNLKLKDNFLKTKISSRCKRRIKHRLTKFLQSSIFIFLLCIGINLSLLFGFEIDIPSPPESKIIKQAKIPFLGQELDCIAYLSSKSQKEIAEYYQRFFKNEGFEMSGEQGFDLAGAIKNLRRIRFKKRRFPENLVIDILLSNKPEGTNIVIRSYTQKQNEPDLENTPLSLKKDNLLFSLPKEDSPGEDLKIIPRPAKSVRWMSLKQENYVFLTYASSLSINELREFYRNNMSYQGWQIQREFATKETQDAYRKINPKTDLAMIKSLFKDGEDLNEIIRDSHLLDFKSNYGKARIAIFANFVDKNLGSIVQITFNHQTE